MVDWQSESDLDSIRNSCDVFKIESTLFTFCTCCVLKWHCCVIHINLLEDVLVSSNFTGHDTPAGDNKASDHKYYESFWRNTATHPREIKTQFYCTALLHRPAATVNKWTASPKLSIALLLISIFPTIYVGLIWLITKYTNNTFWKAHWTPGTHCF